MSEKFSKGTEKQIRLFIDAVVDQIFFIFIRNPHFHFCLIINNIRVIPRLPLRFANTGRSFWCGNQTTFVVHIKLNKTHNLKKKKN